MKALTQVRNERGWSQQRLADESGVNKATINQIERGRRSPNVETLEKLAAALDVEVAGFFPKAQAPLFEEESQQRRSSEAVRESCARIIDDCFALGRISREHQETDRQYQQQYQRLAAVYQQLEEQSATPEWSFGDSLLRHIEECFDPKCEICHPPSEQPVREEFKGRRPTSRAAMLEDSRDKSRV